MQPNDQFPTPRTSEDFDAIILAFGYDNKEVSRSSQKKYFYKNINGCIVEISRDKHVVNPRVSNYSAEIIYLKNSNLTRRVVYSFISSAIENIIRLIEEEVTILTNRMKRNDDIHQL